MSDRQVDSNCEWIGWSFLCGHKQDTMEIWGVVAEAMGGKRMCEFIIFILSGERERDSLACLVIPYSTPHDILAEPIALVFY